MDHSCVIFSSIYSYWSSAISILRCSVSATRWIIQASTCWFKIAWNSGDWVLIIDCEYPMVKTLWVVCKSSTVVDGSKDRPSISHMIGCYIFLEKKSVRKLKKKLNNLRKNKKKIVEIQHTTNFQAQLSTSCYTHFVRLLFYTCISTKNFFYFGLNPRTVVCKRKTLLVKHIHIKQQFKKIDVIKKNFIIHFACGTNIMDSPIYVIIKLWISLFRSPGDPIAH